jgi:hypothetical protein
MGSRLTTADSRPGVFRRLVAALPAFVVVAIAAVGCPPHEATLSITADGVATLVKACQPCAPANDAGIEPLCACTLGIREPPDLVRRNMQARLFLVTPSNQNVRDTSKCMTLAPCADAGRPAPCLAESLNQQLDGAMPQGLGFDGLENPDEVQLVLAFYQPPDAASVASCSRADLVACAGLRPPLGGGNYDITCASCQGGPKNAPGPDNGPCPKPRGSTTCFLQECNDILAKNDY